MKGESLCGWVQVEKNFNKSYNVQLFPSTILSRMAHADHWNKLFSDALWKTIDLKLDSHPRLDKRSDFFRNLRSNKFHHDYLYPVNLLL